MDLEATFICAYCLQVNTIAVDPSEGIEQEYDEDCQVCCRSNHLHIVINEEQEMAMVDAEIP